MRRNRRSSKMGSRDSCSLDKTKMDANVVWQWRIMHVRKYSGSPEPFHYSDKAGLDFNIATKTQNKLDLQLVTNGAVLEVCDFAKTVNEGEKHFIADILENNFNLGVENEQQRIDFATHVLRKVKDLLKNPPGDDYEVFALFDTSECTSKSSHGQEASTKQKADTYTGGMAGAGADDKKHRDEFKFSQTASTQGNEIESQSYESDEQSGKPSTKELKADVRPTLFPYCEEIGLNLGFGAKQSLDPGLLTAGVMRELVQFTRELTSSYSRIFHDVLEHNFQVDLADPRVKGRIWFQASRLLKKRRSFNRGGKTAPDFKNEAFSFKKRPDGSMSSDLGAKRPRTGQTVCTETNTISPLTQFPASGNTENHLNCACVQEEPDPQPDRVTDSANAGNLDHLEKHTNKIPTKSNSSCQIAGVPFFTTSDISSSSVDLWKLRDNRVEQILPALDKEFSRYKWFRRFPLEFNIGFRPKQNISFDALADCVLLKIAKFALAMNSSHQDFIMEILEYNFDLDLQSQHHRKIFACKVMDRVRQLRSCDDVVKFSDDIFELPDPSPSSNLGNQSVGCFVPECSSISEIEKTSLDCGHPPYLHVETKEDISAESVALYTSCNKIGLKLHVKHSQPNNKLEINKLTNAAIMEMIDFVEKLCGTFEQICLDILRHNFDLDLQSEDSDLARNILARIPAAMEQKNLSRYITSYNRKKWATQNMATMEKVECQNHRDFDSCNTSSFQTINMDQSGDSSTEIAYKSELNFKLWKLRANHIQQVLSMPHEEHCPLYSYSRCKKLGIDFNVGSGIKQNLSPNLLTNGIMVELNAFATAMQSARKDFVTEILEYNFDLNLKDELSRSAFAHQTMQRFRVMNYKKCSALRTNMVFDLPDVTYTPDPIYETTTYCPKCYQERNQKLHLDEFDVNQMYPLHPHAMADPVSNDEKYTEQKPAFLTLEERIMDSYPLCKKIGFSLCVDRNYTKAKLDPHLLTLGIINEVFRFAKKLCGTKCKIIHSLLEHNFNICKQIRDVDLVQMFRKATALKDGGAAWLSEVFVIRPVSRRLPVHGSKLKESSMLRNDMKEIIKKRKMALQRKRERAMFPNNMSRVKSKYPLCTEIGLDLDVTAKSGEKEKLDLNLLTRNVVFEIHKFATQKVGHYYPRTVFDILDCNFDLSSQHYRRWEFSVATASKIQAMIKQWKKLDGGDKVFKLPFLFDSQTSEMSAENGQIVNSENLTSESSCVVDCAPFPTCPDISFSGRGVCQDEGKLQTPENVPNILCTEDEKIKTENYYTCPLGDSDLDSGEVTDSENADYEDLLENPKHLSLNSDFPEKSRLSCLGDFANTLSSSELPRSPISVNSEKELSFESVLDEKDLCVGEKQEQPPTYTPDDFDMGQEEMGTQNLWKLRANRVEQILSALNKEFGPFNRSKKVGLEFNVGFGPKQDICVDSLTNSILLEIAKFALAMNSSQQDFIMEILEYNFDLGLQSQHRIAFISEIMNRVRQLNSCEDAVRFSNEVFELPVSTSAIIMADQSEESGISERSSMSKLEICDAPSLYPSHTKSEQGTGVSARRMDPNPCCKEIGLKLHVSSQPIKKLDINTLSNGAMTEVINFAERLCGTFDQICLDILRHNLNSDLQGDGSDLAGITFARIPVAIEQRNLATSVKVCKKIKSTRKDISTMEKLDQQSDSNLDEPQTSDTDRNVANSVETEQENELNSKLWKLRANHIQQILSIPHQESCPLYSYSRCKKLGIDFIAGSGKKQNLDPKLLTNGIMVEFNAFASALVSAQKNFITEILEYNFNLNLKNELSRITFGHQTWEKFKMVKTNSALQKKMIFELPDLTYIQEPTHDKSTYCPKCYQERNQKLCQDEYNVAHLNLPHPHASTGTVTDNDNSKVQKPAADSFSALSKAEEKIMSGYPHCKKIGLNLCVDKEKPKDKLDRDNLTRGVMNEVVSFAKKLCGTKRKLISTLVDHNFNIGKESRGIDLTQMFHRETARKDGGISWFSEVFVIRPVSHRLPGHEKPKDESDMQGSERKETIRQRKLALQMKKARGTMPSKYVAVVKSQPRQRKKARCFPLSAKIGLALNVPAKSKSGEKEKLDLKLLTRAVVFEIHKSATQKVGQPYQDTVFDILDYNFDLSSQYYRCSEFSAAVASKIQTTVEQYRLKRDRPHKIFKLPFVFPRNASQEFVKKRRQRKSKMYQTRKRNEGRCVLQMRYHSDGSHISIVGVAETKEDSFSYYKDTESQMGPFNVSRGQLNIRYCSPLKGNIEIKEEAYDPYYDDMPAEEDTEEKYQHCKYVTTESNPWDPERLVFGEPAGSLGYSVATTYPDLESKIQPESQNEAVKYYMLAKPQRSGGHAMLYACTNTESNVKTELDTAKYLDLDEGASQEYSIVTIGGESDCPVVKEEQENVLPDSYYDEVMSYNESEGNYAEMRSIM